METSPIGHFTGSIAINPQEICARIDSITVDEQGGVVRFCPQRLGHPGEHEWLVRGFDKIHQSGDDGGKRLLQGHNMRPVSRRV